MTARQRDIALVAVLLSGLLHMLICYILFKIGPRFHEQELSETLFRIATRTFQIALAILLAYIFFGWKKKAKGTSMKSDSHGI